MKYELIIRSTADKELKEAANCYELQPKGLGGDFLMCVRATLNPIQISPARHPVICGVVRRAIIYRFPYGIYYFFKADKVYVIAIHHHRRPPSNWQKRY